MWACHNSPGVRDALQPRQPPMFWSPETSTTLEPQSDTRIDRRTDRRSRSLLLTCPVLLVIRPREELAGLNNQSPVLADAQADCKALSGEDRCESRDIPRYCAGPRARRT